MKIKKMYFLAVLFLCGLSVGKVSASASAAAAAVVADLGHELIDAARYDDEEEVKRLIDAGADVDATDQDGWTALMVAANNGHEDMVKLLLAAGADKEIMNIEGLAAEHLARPRKIANIIKDYSLRTKHKTARKKINKSYF